MLMLAGSGLVHADACLRIADREGIVVLYPDGVGRNWNDGRSTREFDGDEEIWSFFESVSRR